MAVGATASHTSGSIVSVDFFVGSQLIGTSTLAPYSLVSTNPAFGIYSVTAKAKDNKNVSVTSNPITVRISKALKSIENGRKKISNIQQSLSSSMTASAPISSNQIASLMGDLDEAYLNLTNERGMFATSERLEKYLVAALSLSRASDALSQETTPVSGINNRLNKVDAYLSFCVDLMLTGVISQSNLNAAAQAKASPNLSITQPLAGATASPLMMLSPNLLALVTATASTPLTSQTASPSSGAYELADVSVTFNGRAALVRSVSPTQLTFTVPGLVTSGMAEILITSRDGHIARTTGQVIGLNPQILSRFGGTSESGAILSADSFTEGAFSTTTSSLLGLDSQMRLAIWASGISSGLQNTNMSNDVWLGNGQVLLNFADLVSVEARTSNGTVFNLPVEYAGAQGQVRGLDQVNVVLIPELANAGTVQLTIVAGGKRSNSMTVVIQ